jgi:hypothetical protein
MSQRYSHIYDSRQKKDGAPRAGGAGIAFRTVAKSPKEKSKSLPPEHTDRARSFVRALIKRDFGEHRNTMTAAATAFGVQQGTLSGFLKDRGAGSVLLMGVADYANVVMDRIVGRSDAELAVALEYNRDTEVPADLVRRIRLANPGEKSPKDWWNVVQAELSKAPTSALARASTYGQFEQEAPRAAAAKRRKARL